MSVRTQHGLSIRPGRSLLSCHLPQESSPTAVAYSKLLLHRRSRTHSDTPAMEHRHRWKLSWQKHNGQEPYASPQKSKHFYRGCLPFGRKQQKTGNVLTACTQTENPVLHKLKLQKLTLRGQLGLHDLGQAAESPSTSIKWAEHPAGM